MNKIKSILFTLLGLAGGLVGGFALSSAYHATCTHESAATNEVSSAAEAPAIVQTIQEDGSIDIVRVSEAFGHMIATNLSGPGFSLDVDAIIRGIRLAAGGGTSPMSEEEYHEALSLLQERAFYDLAAGNLSSAERFLEENASKEGIVQLEEGKLQYSVVQAGTGDIVEQHSQPLIHYTGSFQDGSVFGSSKDSDPITLPLDQTIPGFSKGITGMREGEKRTLYIHPELGYGVHGHLPPNSLLVFEVEVLKAGSPSAGESQTASMDTE